MGTTSASSVDCDRVSGSPPRAWGQRCSVLADDAAIRFTPTCVGTTDADSTAGRSTIRFTPTCVGTTDDSHSTVRHRDRFTPTCVGTTDTIGRLSLNVIGSPPRAWGQLCTSVARSTARGSPPRAWGQSLSDCDPAGIRRFTPTCVGTMPASARLGCRSPVHPHVRGDNRCVSRMHIGRSGSPPRAWGQLSSRTIVRPRHSVHPHVRGDNIDACDAMRLTSRFTPTCVGTTDRCQSARMRMHPVHPHVRGDNLVYVQSIADRRRFTPTCVGTTASCQRCSGNLTVHPHVRGDNACGHVERCVCTVHPHVRGDN